MDVSLELQELDNLIIQHTKPPVTAILRNKLHPLREQLEAYVVAKRELEERLTDEIAKLKEAHRQEIASIAASKANPVNKLSPEAEKILKHVFEKDDDCPAEEIAFVFSMKQSVAKFHIDELGKRRFIKWTVAEYHGYGVDSPAKFAITTQGRDYIMENGLA